MNGREHLYYALQSYSLLIFVLSLVFGYRGAGFLTWFFLAGSMALSLACNEGSNIIESRLKKENSRRKKEKIKDEAKLSKTQRNLVNAGHAGAYLFLVMLMLLCIYVAIPASDHPAFIILGYFCTFFGALLPDIDKTIWDISKHRDPVTHSSLLVLFIACYAIISLPDVYVSAMLCFMGLIAGNTSHLVMDNVESGSTIAEVFQDISAHAKCPGNLHHVRENRERWWLNANAFAGAVMIVLMTIRFNYPDFPWSVEMVIYDAETWNYTMTTGAAIVIILTTGMQVALIGLLATWHDVKKSKKRGK